MEHDSEFTFAVYVISHGRASIGPITAKNFETCTHVVRKSEEEEYAKNGFGNILAIEDSLIDSYDKVFSYLQDNAEEDVIAIVDDDIKYFEYREKETVPIESPETVQAEFERLAQIIYDLRIGLAFGPPTDTPYNYSSEFSWTGMPGAFKIVNRSCIKARMDPKVERNVDVDYVLQELLDNRICVSAKWLCARYYEAIDVNVTGSRYNSDQVKSSLELMKLRWGRNINYSQNIIKIKVAR